jgi:hypothetical protein
MKMVIFNIFMIIKEPRMSAGVLWQAVLRSFIMV